MQSQIENFHNFANKFADQSRSILNEKFRGSFTFQSKKDGSFVTEIDKTIEDLAEKIEKYKRDKYTLKKIARKGHNKYHKFFNSTKVANYIIDKTFGIKSKYFWDKE